MEHGATKPPGSLSGAPRNSAPPERRTVRSDRVVPDEFVFHLHRGVELLEEGRSLEAKEALELALSERPKDPESQALLALVYFRLGLYPRAIEIYRVLAVAHPDTLSLKVNLAVCYLKTGQHALAEEALIAVVGTDPSHTRAWAYLALAHERLGEHGKAARAYELGGHPRQAERARALAEGRPDPLEANRVRDVASAFFDELAEERVEFRLAAPSQPTSRGTWTTHEPGRPHEEAIESDVVTPAAYAPSSLRPTRPPFAPRPSHPPPPDPEIARLPSFSPEPDQPRPATPSREPAPAFEVSPFFGVGPPALGSTNPAELGRRGTDARAGLCVVDVRRNAPLTVRGEGVFGFEGTLEQTPITRELAPNSVETWVRFAGEGRLVLAPRGRKNALVIAPEQADARSIASKADARGFGLAVRPEHVLAHGEMHGDGPTEFEWKDGVRIRLLRLRADALAMLEIAGGLVEMPLRGRAFMIRREVFVACDGGVDIAPYEDAELGQRGLLRATGHGRLLLLRA